MLSKQFSSQVLIDSEKSRKSTRYIKKYLESARENKNTRIYFGSPFLKGYVQSLTP